jgi:hypothetical protein
MSSPVVQTLLATIGDDWLTGVYPIDLTTISQLVSQLIPAIEKLISGKGRGVTKKAVLIEVIHIILTETGHKDLLDTIDPVLPNLIDSMVSMYNMTTSTKKCCTLL